MRSLKSMALVLALIAPFAQAAGIAIVDANKAIEESAANKTFLQELNKQFGKQEQELAKLDTEFQNLGKKLERDGATMSESERAKIELEMRQMQETYRVQRGLLNKAGIEAQRKEVIRLAPVLREAVANVAKAGGYDTVLQSGAVLYSGSSDDITGKVIEQLNKLTSKK